jgi:hypothetical protein
MTTKERVRNGGDRASQQRRTSNCNSVSLDPLQGWFNLTKLSRNRHQERTWKRGKQRGCIDSALAVQLAFLAVVFLLFGGGVAA